MFRPEYVADCFMKLITECDNGAAMAVVKDGPFLVPDTSTFYVIAATIFGKIANKVCFNLNSIHRFVRQDLRFIFPRFAAN